MPDEQIDSLFRQPVCWLMDNGPEDDIAISSRIRLSRSVPTTPPLAESAIPCSALSERWIR